MDNKRKTAINSLVYLIFAIALVVIVNILGEKYHYKIDITENKIYSLSKASKNLVKNLKDNLVIKCFFSEDLPENYEINRKYLKDLLEEYKSYSSGKIKYEFIDPDKYPEWQTKLISLGIPKVQITGISKDKFEIKNIYMGIAFFYQDKSDVIPVLKNISNLEYNISTIIKKLISNKLPVVGFLGAGGTSIPEDELRKLAQSLKSYTDVETIRLIKYLDIQDAVDVLVVVNPRMELSEWAKFQIDQFIMKGKPVIFLVDMSNLNYQFMTAHKVKTNINELLKHYGVEVTDELIADLHNQKIAIEKKVGNFLVQNTINYPFYPYFTNINRKLPFIADFDALYFPLISKIKVNQNHSGKIQWLFKSSQKSFTVKPPYSVDPFQKIDLKKFKTNKPFIGGVLITGNITSYYKDKDLNILKDKFIENKKEKEKYEIFDIEKIKNKFLTKTNKAKIIVIGDADFVKDPLIDNTMLSFFMNMLDWSLDRSGLMNIRAKGIKIRVLKDVSETTKFFIKVFNIIIVPLLLVLLGIIIKILKRTRRNLDE